MSGSIRRVALSATAVALTTTGIAVGADTAVPQTAEAASTTQTMRLPVIAPAAAKVSTVTALKVVAKKATTVSAKKYWYQKSSGWYWTSHYDKYQRHIANGGTGTGTVHPFSAAGQKLLSKKPTPPKAPAKTTTPTKTVSASSSSNGIRAKAVSFAKKKIGLPYGWGATGPNRYDCSGLTMKAFQAAGKTLPRTSQQQSSKATRISASSARAGDLVFWGGKGSSYHVGIYLGGGKYLHAPKTGALIRINSTGWWAPDWYGRVASS